jgi:hypothetical protein
MAAPTAADPTNDGSHSSTLAATHISSLFDMERVAGVTREHGGVADVDQPLLLGLLELLKGAGGALLVDKCRYDEFNWHI